MIEIDLGRDLAARRREQQKIVEVAIVPGQRLGREHRGASLLGRLVGGARIEHQPRLHGRHARRRQQDDAHPVREGPLELGNHRGDRLVVDHRGQRELRIGRIAVEPEIVDRRARELLGLHHLRAIRDELGDPRVAQIEVACREHGCLRPTELAQALELRGDRRGGLATGRHVASEPRIAIVIIVERREQPVDRRLLHAIERELARIDHAAGVERRADRRPAFADRGDERLGGLALARNSHESDHRGPRIAELDQPDRARDRAVDQARELGRERADLDARERLRRQRPGDEDCVVIDRCLDRDGRSRDRGGNRDRCDDRMVRHMRHELLERRLDDRRRDLARDHEHRVRRSVVRIREGTRLRARDRTDARLGPADRDPVRVTRRIGAEHQRRSQLAPHIALPELVQHDCALALERRIVERRAAQAEPDGFDREELVEVRRVRPCHVDRRVGGGLAVEIRRRSLKVREHRVGAEDLLIHEVLDEVSDARLAVRIVDRADLVTHRHRELGSGRVFDDDHPQAIRELELLEAQPEVGRPRGCGRRGVSEGRTARREENAYNQPLHARHPTRGGSEFLLEVHGIGVLLRRARSAGQPHRA